MSQAHEGRTRTFQAGAALSQHRSVRLSSSKLAYAGATDADTLGTLRNDNFAIDDEVAVILRSAQGTQVMVAAGAITAGAKVFAAAAGKVDATGTIEKGIALEAAAADGDWIEVLPTADIPAGTAASAAVADLSQTISGTYDQAEVQAISDKLDELLAARRTAGEQTP